MRTRPIWLVAILFVTIVIASWYFLHTRKVVSPTPIIALKNFNDCRDHNFPIIQSYPEQCTGPDGVIYFQDLSDASSTIASSTASSTQDVLATSTFSYKDQVFLTDLSKKQLIQSPLHVEGRASGSWYFEASFPIKIISAKGSILGQGLAQATEDWMSTSSVPFSADITFVVPSSSSTSSTTGYVVFSKDNPSGLPANSDSFKVPVVFN
ncbi:MAG: Gmad2 immunoglobulin-like domain-containing protein [bacterium]